MHTFASPRAWRVAGLAVPLLLLAACGGGKKPDADAGKAAAAAAAAASAPALALAPVDLLLVQRSSLARGPALTGTVQAERRADVRAELSGVVLEVFKENGEAVKAGDALVRLDDGALRDGQLAADAGVRSAQNSVEQAERALARQQMLAKEGMVSAAAVEEVQLRRSGALNELAAARARASQAREQRRYTVARAPFAGVVAERQVSPGDTAQIGKALMKVIDLGSMRVEAQVSVADAAALRIGQPVVMHVAGATGAPLAGVVRRIEPTANAVTRQVGVVIGFADAAAAPRVAGLFVEGWIETAREATLMLPASAVVMAGDQAQVWRVRADQTLEKIGVVLAERDPRTGDWPVKSGIAIGDRLLRHPGSALVVGQRVMLPAAGPSSAPASASASASAPAPAPAPASASAPAAKAPA